MRQKGFFPRNELLQVKDVQKFGKRQGCNSCGLYKGCKNPKMPVYGKGREKILIIGEAPGCVSGDSLIDTAFRDKSKFPEGVSIRELVGKSGFYVYSFDIRKNKLVLGKVNRVWKTGRKLVYEVSYEWWHSGTGERKINSIKVTDSHLFLLKQGKWRRNVGKNGDNRYASILQGLCIGQGIEPLRRIGINEYSYLYSGKKLVKESRILLEHKLKRKLLDKEQCHHKDTNKLNDSFSNLKLMGEKEHSKYHTMLNNPMDNETHRKTHNDVMASKEYRKKMSIIMKGVLKRPEVYSARIVQINRDKERIRRTLKEKYQTPLFYYNYLLSHKKQWGMSQKSVENRFKEKFPSVTIPSLDNHKIISIKYVGVEDVYDMEIERYHNFAVNGVFVHNSTEDAKGRPFIGESGQLLRKYFDSVLKLDIDRDCWTTNSVRCRPPDNRTPTKNEVLSCKRFLEDDIKELKPNFIFLFGNTAVESYLSDSFERGSGGISRWRGCAVPDQEKKAWIFASYHPSFLLRSAEYPALVNLFCDDLRAYHKVKSLVYYDRFPVYKYMIDFPKTIELVTALEYLLDVGGLMSFDYETTGIKPYVEGHKIVCCSFCTDEEYSTAFMIPEKDSRVWKLWKQVLHSTKVRKMAHNMKFEDTWSKIFFDEKVRGWEWDSMLATHILDNRAGICGLDFQAFVNFGLTSWDSEVSGYLSSGGDSNSFNSIDEIDKRELLKYCGTDSLVQYRLSKLQMERMGA